MGTLSPVTICAFSLPASAYAWLAETPAMPHAITLMPAPRWTPEQAREMAVRGNLAKAAARSARAERLAKHCNGEEFREDTLARVRDLLTDTLERMAKATEPKDRELLARAASHTAEIERRLSGRALPGTRRPGNEAPPPPSALPEPL